MMNKLKQMRYSKVPLFFFFFVMPKNKKNRPGIENNQAHKKNHDTKININTIRIHEYIKIVWINTQTCQNLYNTLNMK